MNKNKCRFIAFWLAAVLLAGFYLGMLICGRSPDVGIEYRMYYITHELSDWPGYGNLSYELGTKEICTSLKTKDNQEFTGGKVCQRKGQGFLPKQYDGSVSTGEASYLYYIPSQASDSAEFQIEVNDFAAGSDALGVVSVYANDVEIGTFYGEGNYSMKLGSITKDELLTIKFVTENCSFRLWSCQII